MEDKKGVIEDAQTKNVASKNGDDADELLQKISEVVKDERRPAITTVDISNSSEKDFFKKIDDNEKSENKQILQDNTAATSSETVVVGELVMHINTDLDTKQNNENCKANLNVLEKVINKNDTNLDEESPVNIGKATECPVNIKVCESIIKKSKGINLKEQSEETEKKRNLISSISSNTESISIDKINISSSNTIEQMEIGSIEKNDMEVEPEHSSTRNITMENSLHEKDNNLSEFSKADDTKEMLTKENIQNIDLDTQNEKFAIKLQNSIESIPANNNEIKKKELTENGEPIITVKKSDVPRSGKSVKENLLKEGSSQKFNNDNLTNNEDKCSDKIIKENETVKMLEVESGQKCLPSNKILSDLKAEDLNTNLNTTPVSSQTVFNSTPILKQFEISSENVSKISEAETSQIHNSVEENIEKVKIEDSTTETETESGCTTSESDNKTSDAINKFVEICKNGIRDTTTDEDENTTKNLNECETNLKIDLPTCSNVISKPTLETKLDGSYEINFHPDENDIIYFSIKRNIGLKKDFNLEKTTSVSSDQGSYGSISSLAPFTLPTTSVSRLSEISSSTSTSCSEKMFVAPLQSKNTTHVFQNKIDLCTFVIDHFTKVKSNIEATTSNILNVNVKKNLNKSIPSVSETVTGNKRSRKRSFNKTQSEDEGDDTSKSKQSKKGTPIKKNDGANEYGDCVLAKWIDKKYYAGRISGEKPGNKFVVLFEDGASKILSKESIVFGEGEVLPLQDQSVYALVDEDDYERGVVISIEKIDDTVYYTVKTDNKTVKITSSDIYLQENQAKIIQKAETTYKLQTGEASEEQQMDTTANNGRATRNKRSLASPVTPEAGFSGSAKTGNKRQKRRQPKVKIISQRNRYASTSEVSDTPDESPLSQMSPEVAIEAIEGVQPEVQKTDTESEICKLIFLSDIESLGQSIGDENILGQLPEVTNIFRNKYFILTCTVGLKPHRYEQTNMFGENDRNRQFSKIPFVKVHLKKQLEAGGGTVYEHFEDIPKSKYRQCKLITSRPCLTAKYIQCLAADIQAISHEWVIDCCTKNRLLDSKKFALPAGWSITKQLFIKWSLGKSPEKRASKQPFSKVYVLLASQHKDFVEYWNRVCKMAGAEVRLIKSLNDITASTKGYMVADMDFPHVCRSKALHFGIQIVSTVWIVESLILGKLCPPNTNRKLLETYQDDDL